MAKEKPLFAFNQKGVLQDNGITFPRYKTPNEVVKNFRQQAIKMHELGYEWEPKKRGWIKKK